MPPRTSRPEQSAPRANRGTADSSFDAIVYGATLAFARYGYVGATTKLIASAADVAPALIYHYFQSKRELYAHVYSSTISDRYKREEPLFSSDMPLPDLIRAVAEDLVSSWQKDPVYIEFHARALYEAERDAELSAVLGEGQLQPELTWTSVVARAQQRGEVPQSIQAEVLVDICLIWFSGLVTFISKHRARRTLMAAEQFASVLEGILTTP